MTERCESCDKPEQWCQCPKPPPPPAATASETDREAFRRGLAAAREALKCAKK